LVSLIYPAALRGRIDMQVREEQRQLAAKKTKQNGTSLPQSLASSPSLRPDDSPATVPFDSAHQASMSSTPRGSFSRSNLLDKQQRRHLRDLSMEIAGGAAADVRSRLRHVPTSNSGSLISAPIARRSISLLQGSEQDVWSHRGSRNQVIASPRGSLVRTGMREPMVDFVHLEILYRIAYRLSILATEPCQSSPVLPSFEYFLAHPDNSPVRIHRASTISVTGAPSPRVASPVLFSTHASICSIEEVSDEDDVALPKHSDTVAPALAMNEPPVPLFLSETMTMPHLIAILGMLVRQVECAVEAIERRSCHYDNHDSLQTALAELAADPQGVESGFEWTKEHVMRALAAYVSGME
ncbi:hypothetical protein EC988_007257, partial [Linderina pennispora]